MRHLRPALLAGAALLAACADQGPIAPVRAAADAAPLLAASPGRGIGGSYVVVLNQGADPRSVAAVAGVEPRLVYAAALNGFAAALNAGQLEALRHNPNVTYVEEDQTVEARATQSSPPWGLDRIDQRNLPLTSSFTYGGTGASVRAYVIDTGIAPALAGFGGRVQNVYDAFGGNGADCNGHGTGVAAVIGSTTHGVAKGVQLRGVRVLDCNGTGTTSGIIAAVDWVRLNAQRPAVANMSLGGGASTALNTAVNNLASSLFTAVAAGHSGSLACNYSPAGAANAFTTAASTITDTHMSGSNYGSCVDGYAPGANIPTLGLNGAVVVRSGTSMAAPHVAGVGVLYLASFPSAAASTVDSWIKTNATVGVLTGVPAGTPNRLLYKGTL
ncbi:MAG TPA: S8 family peptidase [Longimicrobiaceae bacterium]